MIRKLRSAGAGTAGMEEVIMSMVAAWCVVVALGLGAGACGGGTGLSGDQDGAADDAVEDGIEADADSVTDADAGADPDAGAEGGDEPWILTFGSALDDYGINVELDSEGSVVFCGYFSDTMDFSGTRLEGAGGLDLVAAKLSHAGELIWVHRVGGAGDDREPSIAVDASGNVALAGEFGRTFDLDGTIVENHGESDLLVVRYSANGDVVRVSAYGGPGMEMGPKVAFDGEGDLFLAAGFEGTVDFGGQSLTASDALDVVVAKFSGIDGALLWAKRFGGAADEAVHGIAVNAGGDVSVTGWFGNSIDFGGDAFSPGGAFIAKLAGGDGAHRWSRAFINGENNSGCGLAFDGSGDVFLSGWFQGELDLGAGPAVSVDFTDLFVAKYAGSTGEHLWSRPFGGSSVDSSCAAAATGEGDVVIGGFYAVEIDFGGGPLTERNNGFFSRFSGRDGAHVWSHGFGGAGGDYVDDVAAGADGCVVITGSFSQQASFFGEPLSSAGRSDGFIAGIPSSLL